jgi:uncharacterized protein YidB (DUF937 family)
MSLFESLRTQVVNALTGQSGAGTGAERANVPSGLFDGVVAMIRDRGVASLVESLNKAGLADTVASWVGTGKNLPISADQLRSALGPETIEALATRAGLPPGEASALLAKFLPGLVDHLTPGGTVDESRLTPDPGATRTVETEG